MAKHIKGWLVAIHYFLLSYLELQKARAFTSCFQKKQEVFLLLSPFINVFILENKDITVYFVGQGPSDMVTALLCECCACSFFFLFSILCHSLTICSERSLSV